MLSFLHLYSGTHWRALIYNEFLFNIVVQPIEIARYIFFVFFCPKRYNVESSEGACLTLVAESGVTLVTQLPAQCLACVR